MIYKIKQKHTKHTTMYTMVKKWNQKNMKEIEILFVTERCPCLRHKCG